MKQQFFSIVLIVLLSFCALSSFAQESEPVKPAASKWVSDKGYWVIVSNKNSPDVCTVHFYNNDHTEIYTRRVEGKVLNVERKNTLKQLKLELDASLLAYEKSEQTKLKLAHNAIQAKQ